MILINYDNLCDLLYQNAYHKLPQSDRGSLLLDKKKGYLYTHPFNGPFSGTTKVSRYQKGKTNLDFSEARDNEWQWHQLGHMQVCTLLQTDNHASTPPLCFLQAGCRSCRPTNSVKTLKAILGLRDIVYINAFSVTWGLRRGNSAAEWILFGQLLLMSQ